MSGFEASFAAWLEKEEVTHCLHRVGELPARYVVAARELQPGDTVVSLPDTAVLNASSCSIAEVLEKSPYKARGQQPLLRSLGLVMALMAELADPDSRWRPYLNDLPAHFPHMPHTWPPQGDAWRALRGTAVAAKLAGVGSAHGFPELPTQVDRLWTALVRPFLQRRCRPLGVPLGDLPPAELRALYLRATALVASYSFRLGDDRIMCMAPVFDALDHSTAGVNVRLHHDAETEHLSMIATRPIPTGAQVFNSYGALASAELLRRYGFVESPGGPPGGPGGLHPAPAPPRCCQIPVSLVLQAVEEASQVAAGGEGNGGGQAPAEAGRPAGPVQEESMAGPAGEGSAGEDEAKKRGLGRFGVEKRLGLLAKLGELPRDGWFRIGPDGKPSAGFWKCLDTLCMGAASEEPAQRVQRLYALVLRLVERSLAQYAEVDDEAGGAVLNGERLDTNGFANGTAPHGAPGTGEEETRAAAPTSPLGISTAPGMALRVRQDELLCWAALRHNLQALVE